MRYSFLLFMLFTFHGLFGQEVDRSTEVWHAVHLKKKIYKWWDSDLRLEGRYAAEESQMDRYLIESDNSIEILDWLDGGVLFRYTSERFDDDRWRVGLQAYPEYDMGAVELGLRMRYEWNGQDGDIEERLRVKFRPQFKIKDHDFEGFMEWFLEDVERLQRTRYGVGWKYKLNKRNSIYAKWMVDVEEFDEVFIYRLGFQRRFK